MGKERERLGQTQGTADSLRRGRRRKQRKKREEKHKGTSAPKEGKSMGSWDENTQKKERRKPKQDFERIVRLDQFGSFCLNFFWETKREEEEAKKERRDSTQLKGRKKNEMTHESE